MSVFCYLLSSPEICKGNVYLSFRLKFMDFNETNSGVLGSAKTRINPSVIYQHPVYRTCPSTAGMLLLTFTNAPEYCFIEILNALLNEELSVKCVRFQDFNMFNKNTMSLKLLTRIHWIQGGSC